MILTKEIIYNDHSIKIEDLSLGSNKIITAKCDYCEKEKEISYKEYNRNIKNNGKFSCCQKCGCLKAKETNMEKYGVESTNKLESVKNKIKNTIQEKYGVEHISQIQEIKDIKKEKWNNNKEEIIKKISDSWNKKDNLEEINNKRKESIKEKYGVDNISQLESIKEKKKETIEKNYGEFGFGSEIINKKIRDTIYSLYGTDNIRTLEYVNEKIRNTNLEKYGVEYPSMSFEIKNKIKNTILEKYGTENIMHSEIFKKHQNDKSLILFEKKYDIKINSYCENILNIICCKCENNYNISYNLMKNRHFLKVEKCLLCNPINSQTSDRENKLLEFIKENYNGEILENDRKILNGKELDIYLPDLNLAFEFNGLYWHSELYKDNKYHINKTEKCLENGIQLIHIWEDDWDYKNEIVKSMIINKLQKTPNKIYARKCEIKEINDNKTIRDFLEKNHIQGFVGSSIKIGLFYENELVSLMTFGKKRKFMNSKSKDGEFELLRFCNKINTNIIGGASKLYIYFIKNYSFTEIITYADRSHSNGNLYKQLGFNFMSKTPPNYYYIINGVKNHRFGFRKDVLIKEGFDKNKSEHEIMIERGINRIYDSGSLKFVFYF